LKRQRNIIKKIFEDDDILVVSKPAGMLSVPDRYDRDLPNLKSIFRKEYGEIFVVHRLDKDTSGIMVFAKNAEAHRNLSIQFEELRVKKVYHCVVSGNVIKDEMEIDIPLMSDPSTPGRTIPSVRGKDSYTLLKVIKRFKNSTLVKCLLVTGRHHQIRAHCAAIGHPLLVDPLYGNASEFKLSQIKRRMKLKKDTVEQPLISRITMHAYELAFLHPVNDEEMQFTAEYPKDFSALLQVLNKYASIENKFI
jgi:RluA family pseudouridine synthase